MEQNTKIINIPIPAGLHQQMKEISNRMNISMSSFVRMACTEYVKKMKNK